MSHMIEKNDMIYSNQGAEWHGLAHYKTGDGIPYADLSREIISPILFPVREISGLSGFDSAGRPVQFPDYRGIAADLTGRPDGTMIPLSVQSDGYKIIENSEIWEAVKNGLADVPHVVTAAGTLGDCRRFFLTVQLTEAPEFIINGEKWKSYVNFISSHDGTLALAGYDSSVRIVCQNTLRFSQSKRNRGQHRLSIVHKKGATLAVANMSAWLESMLKNRTLSAQALERLLDIPLNPERVEKIVTGYAYLETKEPDELSTRALNQVSGIIDRVYNGNGNAVASGRADKPTAFDLLNGFTDFFTNGNGAGGKDVPAVQSRINSLFGGAAEKKESVASAMMADCMEWLASMETASDRYKTGLERAREKSGMMEPAPQLQALRSMSAGIM